MQRRKTENRNIFVLTDQETTILQIFVAVTSCKTFFHRQVTSGRRGQNTQKAKTKVYRKQDKNRSENRKINIEIRISSRIVSLLHKLATQKLAKHDTRTHVVILKLVPWWLGVQPHSTRRSRLEQLNLRCSVAHHRHRGQRPIHVSNCLGQTQLAQCHSSVSFQTRDH